MAAFEAGVFEELHGRAVALLAGGADGSPELRADALAGLRGRKDAFSRPLVFRGREDTVDLSALARHVLVEHPRLASEPLVRAIDEASRSLRLHQHDCCKLVEQSLDISEDLRDVPRRCAAIYYRECHFMALCLHDMAQGLSQTPPDRYSIAFFACLGGSKFVKAVFEALDLLLRDLTGERAGDQAFMAHAGAVIQLFVETLLAYFFALKATAEEAELIISLLPHVVMTQHVPLGNGFTVSDLDLILREEHADISIKLSLVLICMFHSQLGDGSIDIAKVPEDANPELQLQDLPIAPDAGGLLSSSSIGDKIKAGGYWNEESQLGQFLCFMISGVLLENESALRNGYVHWHIFHFILHEVLLSSSIVGVSCTSKLVLRCVQELLTMALLPAGRRWIAVRKLEAQAVSYRLMAPDALQIAVLQTLNRLCRAQPAACEAFRDIALLCTEAFHLQSAQDAPLDPGGPEPWSAWGAWGHGDRNARAPAPGPALGAALSSSSLWLGAPPSSAGPPSAPVLAAARHDNTALYAEILEFLATLCARGPLHCARFLCQRLMSHSNQWFNWGFLIDTLVQHARAPPQSSFSSRSSSGAGPIIVASCHLVSAICSTRLAVSQPPPQLSSQALQAASQMATPRAETFGPLILELLGSHPDPAVKTACLGALSHLDLTPAAARTTFASLVAVLPTLVAGVGGGAGGARGCCDGALAVELLACALRLAQAVPLGRGRHGMDLLPLTHVVVHHVLLGALADAARPLGAARHWRLAALALRWLRLVLRGPLPLGTAGALNVALVKPYADSEAGAAEVAARGASGSATAFAFRCLLSLDSPVLTRALSLTLLGGRGAEGLAERRRGAAWPFMEQTARAGLDVLRLLFQRDVLFCRLYGQQATGRVGREAAGLDAGDLQLAHQPLLKEYAFAYPPAADDTSKTPAALNPFAGRRVWQSAGFAPSAIGAGSRRANPSYLSLLVEFVGVQASPEISKLAMYTFIQSALREPGTVLRILQLEPWRLQCLSADIFDRIIQPEEESSVAAAVGSHGKWDAAAEEQFMFEAMEMDVAPSAAVELDVSSFQTGLPICRDVDAVYQLADDSVVQAADLAAWARSLGWAASSTASVGLHGGASADASRFRAAYLRGLDAQADWIGEAAAHAGAAGVDAPPPVLATAPCRLLALRAFVLLLGGAMLDDVSGVASSLAQALLGLDPDAGAAGAADIDVDPLRAGQPCPLDAVMELLESPPPLPALEDPAPAGPSGSSALRPRRADGHFSQALEQHGTYESALGIIVGLLAVPALRDVALRYMCHAWPSRYEILQKLLGLPLSSAPPALRRVLLSEVALMLRVLSWEMRLVQPVRAAPPPDVDRLDMAGRQRLEMKRAVAEHLQEVVHALVTPAASSEPPFLVAAALQLADACEQREPTFSLQTTRSLFQDTEHELLQAAECMCLAPSENGRLCLCLKLHDPHLFQRLLSRQHPLPSWGDAAPMHSLARTSSAIALGDPQSPHGLGPGELGASNEHACALFFANLVVNSLSLFASAVLYHLAGGMRQGVLARDPRVQVVRTHLEALLPALDGPALTSCSPHRLELLVRFATTFIVAMQQTEAPAPLAFVQEVFSIFRGAAMRPCGTPAATRQVQLALLLMLQRMLPDPWCGTGVAPPEIAAEALVDLRGLVGVVLASACMAADVPPRADGTAALGVALPLLVALLVRVPPSQLGQVFAASDHWQQLLSLLRAAWASAGDSRPSPLRFQATCAVAVLCQDPVLAVAFFESAGLAAVLRPDLVRTAQPWAAPSGLALPDAAHPAALLVVLQVLAAIVGALPAHRLALHSALAWLERHKQPLLELLLWVTRLPLATTTEPPVPGLDGLNGSLLEAGLGGLRTATVLASAAANRSGAHQESALLVLCTRSIEDTDRGLALAASALGGPGLVGGGAEHGGAAALRCRCAALFAELWASLWVGVLRCSSQSAILSRTEPLWCSLVHLEPPFEAVLLSLLAQMSSTVERPPQGDVLMCDAAGSRSLVVPGAEPPAAAAQQAGESPVDCAEACPTPSKATRLATCAQVLRVWRHDSVAQQLRALARRRRAPAAEGLARDVWAANASTDSAHTSHMGTILQHIGQVRARANVLCSVFVHSCGALLGLRFVSPPPTRERSPLQGSPHLRFEGSSAHFRLLLTVVEMALHLLSEHLTALAAVASLGGAAAATASGAAVVAVHPALPATAGAPRLALVLQYLRALRQFAGAAGGAVVPVEDRTGTAATSMPLPMKAADLTFAAYTAEHVEELLSELQGL